MGVPMNKKFTGIILLTFLFGIALMQGQDRKIAQTGMKFLNVGASAQATGMAEAITSIEGQSMSMFYNPAGMARQESFVDVYINQTQWIADITHNFASISINPEGGTYGVIGLTLQFVDYGDLQRTIRADNTQGFLELGTFKPAASAIGIGYANALSDRFSVGGNIKFVNQDLGTSTTGLDPQGGRIDKSSSTDVLVFDFGMLYKTGFKSLQFGVSVRNFSKEVKYEEEGFQLPLIFKIGLSMNLIELLEMDKATDSFILAVDATHPRDYPEQINLGAEYTFMKLLSVRGGYMFNNDEYGLTAGVGVQKDVAGFHLGVDYSYMPFGVFSTVHRIAFQLSVL